MEHFENERFRILQETINGITIFRLAGEITIVAEQIIAREQKKSPDLKKINIILDFEKVTYINSSGIAVLITIIQENLKPGGNIIFTGLSDHYMRVMGAVGITQFVQIHNTVNNALNFLNSRNS